MDPGSRVNPDPRRKLPSVDRLSKQVSEIVDGISMWAARAGSRAAVAEAREALSGSGVPGAAEEIAQRAVEIAQDLSVRRPRRVVNATGVVLHTNLGRAPLGPVIAEAVREAALGYSDLELDLSTGRRGDRLGRLGERLALLAGSEAGYACNNNAAALLLALDTLARGREVIVSRGELVEIGGSFRVPEIMERAGVRLVEVGSTNRTHLEDYERAIGPDTALLLKVHRSNFEQVGFVAEVDLPALVQLGRQRAVPVVEDLGSGTLVDLRSRGLESLPGEAFVPERVGFGPDVVCFSGDKLLGGPQAGIAVGRHDPIAAMRRNPLARALRLDKLGIAALGAATTALLEDQLEAIPVLAQLLLSPEALRERAEALAEACRVAVDGRFEVSVEPESSPVGGGTLPGFALPTHAVVVRGPANRLASALRRAEVPVVARVRDDVLLFDPRTLLEGDVGAVAEALSVAVV